MKAVERAHALRPRLRQRPPITPIELEPRPARVTRTDFKPRRIDQAIDRIVGPVRNHARRRDPIDPAPFRIDQCDIRPVERIQIFVVKARPLAELPVVRLQRFCNLAVLDHLVDARTHLLHLLEIGEFHQLVDRERLPAPHILLRALSQDQVANDLRPPVADQILGLIAAGQQNVEVVHPPLLPPGLKRVRPRGIGRPVRAHVDRRRRPLKHIEMLRCRTEMRHALHRRCASADDADNLVFQTGQIAVRVATRVLIVPAARMKRMPLETFDARNPRQLGPMQRPAGQTHEARLHRIPAIGLDRPARRRLVPAHRRDLGLKHRVAIKPELLADRTRMLQNLRRPRVLLDRHVAHFFEQRQIDVRLDIARRPRIAVPVPSPAEVAALLDDPNALDPGFTQPRRNQQPAEPTADDDDIDLVGQRRTLHWRNVRVLKIVRELPLDLLILRIPIRPQPPVPLRPILLAQSIRIEPQIGSSRTRRLTHERGLAFNGLTICQSDARPGPMASALCRPPLYAWES